jgi:tRNA (guanine37-N1)-methyltransferase
MSSFFRPPSVRHTFGILDRALFAKTVNLAAAAVADKKKIAQWRQTLSKERAILSRERLSAVIPHPDQTLASQGARCILLDPKLRPGGKQTHQGHWLMSEEAGGYYGLHSDQSLCA